MSLPTETTVVKMSNAPRSLKNRFIEYDRLLITRNITNIIAQLINVNKTTPTRILKDESVILVFQILTLHTYYISFAKLLKKKIETKIQEIIKILCERDYFNKLDNIVAQTLVDFILCCNQDNIIFNTTFQFEHINASAQKQVVNFNRKSTRIIQKNIKDNLKLKQDTYLQTYNIDLNSIL
jgi:hypothetical protein